MKHEEDHLPGRIITAINVHGQTVRRLLVCYSVKITFLLLLFLVLLQFQTILDCLKHSDSWLEENSDGETLLCCALFCTFLLTFKCHRITETEPQWWQLIPQVKTLQDTVRGPALEDPHTPAVGENEGTSAKAKAGGYPPWRSCCPFACCCVCA